MRVFEWWGGEYHPLEDLIAEMDEEEVIRILKSENFEIIEKYKNYSDPVTGTRDLIVIAGKIK